MSCAPRPQTSPSTRSPDHGSRCHSDGSASTVSTCDSRPSTGPSAVAAQARDEVRALRRAADERDLEARAARTAPASSSCSARSSPGGLTVLWRMSCCSSATARSSRSAPMRQDPNARRDHPRRAMDRSPSGADASATMPDTAYPPDKGYARLPRRVRRHARSSCWRSAGSSRSRRRSVDLLSIGLVHALALMALVGAIGSISGCHVNPAVTLALLTVRKISPRDAGGLPRRAARRRRRRRAAGARRSSPRAGAC